jgi:hypothetical protein
MTRVRRTLTGLAVAGLAAAGTVAAAPTAHAAPVGCSEPYRIVAKTGWFTTDDDGTVRAGAAADEKDVAQQFRFCTPPDWQRRLTVIRSEALERYLLPDTLTGQVRAVSSSPTAANVVEPHVGVGGDGSFFIYSPAVKAYYDALDHVPGAPVHANADLVNAETVRAVPVP